MGMGDENEKKNRYGAVITKMGMDMGISMSI